MSHPGVNPLGFSFSEVIACVVPVSGGKDSQACLQLAIDQYGPASVRGLFCDTHFEHPKTYAHIDFMRRHYGVQIESISGGTVDEKCIKYKRFPSGKARFCTDELKMRPSRDWYAKTATEQGGFEVWYGMRTGESFARAARYAQVIDSELYQPHELFPVKYPKRLGSLGVRFRLPIVDWSSAEVFALIGATANPLYAEGFGRVGCFPCLASGARSMSKAFGHDKFGHAQSERVITISKAIGRDPMASSAQSCAVCFI